MRKNMASFIWKNKPQCWLFKKMWIVYWCNQRIVHIGRGAAKSTHGFDGFDRPIYIFAQNRVAQNLNFCGAKNIQIILNNALNIY